MFLDLKDNEFRLLHKHLGEHLGPIWGSKYQRKCPRRIKALMNLEECVVVKQVNAKRFKKKKKKHGGFLLPVKMV